MAEDSRGRQEDSNEVELSEEELKEARRLEAKAQAEKQKVLKSKDNLYGAVLVDLNLTGLNL